MVLVPEYIKTIKLKLSHDVLLMTYSVDGKTTDTPMGRSAADFRGTNVSGSMVCLHGNFHKRRITVWGSN